MFNRERRMPVRTFTAKGRNAIPHEYPRTSHTTKSLSIGIITESLNSFKHFLYCIYHMPVVHFPG